MLQQELKVAEDWLLHDTLRRLERLEPIKFKALEEDITLILKMRMSREQKKALDRVLQILPSKDQPGLPKENARVVYLPAKEGVE